MAKVECYREDWNRIKRHQDLLEFGTVFTYEQVRDAVELVKANEIPDGRFSDAECELWSLVNEVRKFLER